jgi:hypothetical protein
MRNPNNPNGKKTGTSEISITATLLEPRLLKSLVERLAYRRYDVDHVFEKVEPGWEAIETSSIEAYVSGDINLSTQKDFINMSFMTCFLFTCKKAKNGKYNLALCSSLS